MKYWAILLSLIFWTPLFAYEFYMVDGTPVFAKYKHETKILWTEQEKDDYLVSFSSLTINDLADIAPTQEDQAIIDSIIAEGKKLSKTEFAKEIEARK